MTTGGGLEGDGELGRGGGTDSPGCVGVGGRSGASSPSEVPESLNKAASLDGGRAEPPGRLGCDDELFKEESNDLEVSLPFFLV